MRAHYIRNKVFVSRCGKEPAPAASTNKSRPMIARYESGEFPIPKSVELAFKVIEEEERR